jgi:hypothetical protein
MKAACHLAVGLSLLAAANPMDAQEVPPPAWLTQGIEKAAMAIPRTPAVEQRGEPQSDWSAVVALKSGLPIRVARAGAPPFPRRFAWADDAMIVVIDVDHPRVTREVRRALLDIVSTRPQDLRRLADGLHIVHGNVRIGPNGVFVAAERVADLTDIVQQIPRREVAAITAPRRHASIVGGIVGGGIGGFVGYIIASRLALSTNNKAQAWVVPSLVGFPSAGALLGSQADRGATERIIYRAPTWSTAFDPGQRRRSDSPLHGESAQLANEQIQLAHIETGPTIVLASQLEKGESILVGSHTTVDRRVQIDEGRLNDKHDQGRFW